MMSDLPFIVAAMQACPQPPSLPAHVAPYWSETRGALCDVHLFAFSTEIEPFELDQMAGRLGDGGGHQIHQVVFQKTVSRCKSLCSSSKKADPRNLEWALTS